jgi:hypothetical protein
LSGTRPDAFRAAAGLDDKNQARHETFRP